ncbi:hypothetical protein H2198_008905 [Neophaeococcomyces mojaviensis]|uniref:Uncharacterized protein n=1 Tax=Neophaeococcomyces mojaviensis TaxID=3383035 RepID=A0ACC2ZWC8_9EURO|nr:hypothetical protein H2198_008905 [Knufia sp. JES_112]
MSWRYTSVPTNPSLYPQQTFSPYPAPHYSWSPYQGVQPPSPAVHTPLTPFEQIHTSNVHYSPRQHRRRCFDYPTTLALISVWVFLTFGCVVLLYFSHFAAKEGSEAGANISQDEIAGTVGLSAIPILLATVLNEVLMDRCWRRVVYSALGHNAAKLDDKAMAKNLRAANFEWLNCVKRLFTCRISWQEFRTLASYGLLRWGTAISIASIQLCVSWRAADVEGEVTLYSASRRYAWLVGPAFIHSCSVFGTMAIWLMPPWTFFSDRFHDLGLLKKYTPYLERVPRGSAAKYEEVARYLDPPKNEVVSLQKENRPGIQLLAKLKGIWLGLLSMNIPPALAWAYFRYINHDDVLQYGLYRFALHLVFLAQNILYLLALDFAVWNVSLEGFCKRTSEVPNKNLRHLGSSSGIMLLIKAVKQRRPIRAAIYMWFFWVQSCLMRCMSVLYILCITIFSYGTLDDRDEFYDPNFWLGWVIMTTLFVGPLFLFWLFTEFQAPICEQDGWRWAKIARNALFEDGFYGVRNGEAVWARHVLPFDSCRGQMLS